MKPLRLTPIAAAVFALCLTAAAHAEEAETVKEAAPPVMQKVEIKGAAASYDARRDDTASKTVVGSEEIQKYGDTSVNDVLKRLPGITVSGAAGRSGGEIRMRGLGSGYTQILINGERAPAGFAIDSLAPDVIERIEILRAASAEFSTQSIAGTINIVLKKALKAAQHEVKFSEGKGSKFSSPSVSLQMSDKDGRMSYSFGGNAWRYMYNRMTPSFDSGTDAAGMPNLERSATWRDQGRSDGFNLSPRVNWTLDGGDTLTSQSFFNLNQFASNSHSRIDTEFGAPPDYDPRRQHLQQPQRLRPHRPELGAQAGRGRQAGPEGGRQRKPQHRRFPSSWAATTLAGDPGAHRHVGEQGNRLQHPGQVFDPR